MFCRYFEIIQKAMGNNYMGAVVKRSVILAVTLRSPKMYREVGFSSVTCRRIVRPSDRFVSVLPALFLIVFPGASVY